MVPMKGDEGSSDEEEGERELSILQFTRTQKPLSFFAYHALFQAHTLCARATIGRF